MHLWWGPWSSKPVEGLNKALCGFDSHTLPLAAFHESVVSAVAERLGTTATAVALAWLLQRSRVMLPIPGTSKVAHLEENVAAVDLSLTPEDLAELDGTVA